MRMSRDTPEAEVPNVRVVSQAFFAALGVKTLAGRTFAEGQESSGALQAVVSETFARAVWPARAAVGQQLRIGARGEPFTVIGVVADAKEFVAGPTGVGVSQRPTVYFSAVQARAIGVTLVFRAAADVLTARTAIAAAFGSLDPFAPVPALQTDDQRRLQQMLPIRLAGTALSLIAVAGFCLAIVGTYGLVAHSVTRRTKEIGVRRALGATAGDIVRLVLSDGLRFAARGLGVGTGLAVLVGVLLHYTLLNGRGAIPAAIIGAAVVFLAAVILACVGPALVAARLQPTDALRSV